jgi:hypothetical protein
MAEKDNYQYLILLKNNSSKTPTQEAEEARDKGAVVLYVYDSDIKGFAIKVPNDKVLESIIEENPNVDYIEPDMILTAQDQPP